ncbi:RHS repeat-associated core domain-containing protein [Kineococcus sp. NPDC059986]|uniref:RHS repeat domain-containing protein n=1 Tax=Kineococcus sp. NPDC059986 TaxID=3155538 RepID=UPI00344DEF6F
MNRTVVGGTPTTAWAPPAKPGGAGKVAASPSDASGTGAKLLAAQTSTQASTQTATQSQSASAASAQSTPTTGFPGAGASGAGLGIQSYYGLESFNLTSTLTAGVNLANGNLVVRDQALTRNAPGLSVNLDTFFNTLNTAQGSLSYGGSLSTGQDIGLQVGTSTTTFYGPSGFTAAFTATSSGGWTSPGGVNADLVHNSDGTWSLTYHVSSEKLTFTAGGYLIKDVDRNGVGLTLSYDSANRLSSLTDANGQVTTFTYSSLGLTQITDPVGRSVTIAYYSGGGVHTITDATGAVTTFDNSRTGGLDGIQTPDGNWTYFTYDGASRVTAVTRYLTAGATSGNAAVTGFAYNTTSGTSTSTRETSPTGGVSTFALDSTGRVTSVTDPLGRMRSQTWTPNSDLATTTDAGASSGTGTGGTGGATGAITTYSYDTLNNRTAVQLPTGAAARASYTAASGSTGTAYQPKTATDAAGNTSAYTYDGVGNILTVKDTTATTAGGTGATTSTFTYQAATTSTTSSPTQCGGKTGQVCTSTDGNGNVTTYRYDANGNLTKVTPTAPLGATTLTYDSANRVTSVTDGKGQKTQYAYDADDRITTTTFAGGATVTNSYDADGNLTQSADSAAGTSSYTYDALDREVSRQQPNMSGNSFATGYDNAGNITSVDDIYGQVTYSYDAANELTSMTEPDGSSSDTITFTYDTNGAETSRTFPGGLVQTTTRDASERPTRITDAVGSFVVSDLGYSYTVAGGSGTSGDRALVQSRTDYAGTTAPAGSVTAYGHDGLNRLTKATEKTTTGAVNASWAYTYDKAGNRTGVTTAGATTPTTTASTGTATTTWGYNGANEAVSRNSSTTGWSYDANGNQTAAPTWGTGSYNARDALTSATPTGSSTAVAYSYLGAGNGARQSVGAVETINGPLGLQATFTGTSGTAFRYTPDGRLISAGLPDGTNRYYTSDNLGNVTAVATDSAITAQYSYDPYGGLRASSGSEAGNNPMRYGQGYTDTATGLTKLGVRYYDPAQGRFTQQDPTGQDPQYIYAKGCPSTYNDPTGALPHACLVGTAALVLGFLALVDPPTTPFGIGVTAGSLAGGTYSTADCLPANGGGPDYGSKEHLTGRKFLNPSTGGTYTAG